MCDDFARMLCRRTVLRACQQAKFDAVNRTALEVFENVTTAYVEALCCLARDAATLSDRRQGPTLNDVGASFEHLGIDTTELAIWFMVAAGSSGPEVKSSTDGLRLKPLDWSPAFPMEVTVRRGRRPVPARLTQATRSSAGRLDPTGPSQLDASAIPVTMELPEPPGQVIDCNAPPTLDVLEAALAEYNQQVEEVRRNVEAARAERQRQLELAAKRAGAQGKGSSAFGKTAKDQHDGDIMALEFSWAEGGILPMDDGPITSPAVNFFAGSQAAARDGQGWAAADPQLVVDVDSSASGGAAGASASAGVATSDTSRGLETDEAMVMRKALEAAQRMRLARASNDGNRTGRLPGLADAGKWRAGGRPATPLLRANPSSAPS